MMLQAEMRELSEPDQTRQTWKHERTNEWKGESNNLYKTLRTNVRIGYGSKRGPLGIWGKCGLKKRSWGGVISNGKGEVETSRLARSGGMRGKDRRKRMKGGT